jgi:hypothetical protein
MNTVPRDGFFSP